jgi:hypothetical protein
VFATASSTGMLVFFVHHESPRAFHFATNKLLLYLTIFSSSLLFVEVPSSPCVQNSKGAKTECRTDGRSTASRKRMLLNIANAAPIAKWQQKHKIKKQRKETAKAIWHQGQWYTQKD